MKYFDVIKKILSAKIYYWRTSLIPKNKIYGFLVRGRVIVIMIIQNIYLNT